MFRSWCFFANNILHVWWKTHSIARRRLVCAVNLKISLGLRRRQRLAKNQPESLTIRGRKDLSCANSTNMLVLVAVVRVRLVVVFDLPGVLVLVAVSCANSTNMLVLVVVVGRVRLVVVFDLPGVFGIWWGTYDTSFGVFLMDGLNFVCQKLILAFGQKTILVFCSFELQGKISTSWDNLWSGRRSSVSILKKTQVLFLVFVSWRFGKISTWQDNLWSGGPSSFSALLLLCPEVLSALLY